MDPARLADLEEIKQLKARYFRLMDGKQWEAWGDVFTEDCTMDSGGPGSPPQTGRENIVAFVRAAIDAMITTHHGHTPEITFGSDREASGIWAMFDYLEGPGYRMKGWGHYHETYRKCEDGRWRIASTRLSRLRVEADPKQIEDALWPEGRARKNWSPTEQEGDPR
jgi:uncharacterized protein (TIGR02246 family)